jgi:hypothetical protein
MKPGLLLLIAALTLSAKDLSDWSRVSGIGKGDAVEVVRRGGEAVGGSLNSATESAISVQSHGNAVAVNRLDVAEVRIKKGAKARWIGLVAGAIGGIAGGAALGARLANEGAASQAGVAAGVGAAGAAIGFGIGASLDAGYKTIYRSR